MRKQIAPAFPGGFLSCDLVWWRSEEGYETLVSIYGGQWLRRLGPRAVDLQFVLVDPRGAPLFAWQERLEFGACTFASSSDLARQFGVDAARRDGVLAIFALDPEQRVTEVDERRCSLYPTVDWYTDSGDIATLHSDQTVQREHFGRYGLTEIVIDPAFGSHSLIVLNGLTPQHPGSICIKIQSQSGRTLERGYERRMEPLSVNRFSLGDEAELRDLADGGSLYVTGHLGVRGLFARPYVVSDKPRFGAYHAGDLYRRQNWQPLDSMYYDLLGSGESNPMMVEITESQTTIANLLNSHGELEQDFSVDVRLYDEAGELIADRPRVGVARRHRIDRIDLRALLPRGLDTFRGHAAFAFSRDPAVEAYPCHLQVLMEYRSSTSCSRVMVWSDDWNSPIRRKKIAGATLRGYYRAWWTDSLRTTLSITNHGLPDKQGPYSVAAPYQARLINARGAELSMTGTLSPQATRMTLLNDFFPSAESHLAPEGYGMVIVDSPYDLAMAQITRHTASGAIAAEHFMAAATSHKGSQVLPAGS